MHLRKGGIWHILAAVALIAFALQVAGPLSAPTAAHADIGSPNPGNGQIIPGNAFEGPTAPNSISTNGGQCGGSGLQGTTTASGVSGPLTASCEVSADPGLAFNVVGTNHTVVFTCGAAIAGFGGAGTNPSAGARAGKIMNGPGAGTQYQDPITHAPVDFFPPGCYDVTASVSDEFGGAASFTGALCGSNPTVLSGSTVNCGPYFSPLCPIGYVGATAGIGTTLGCIPTGAGTPSGLQPTPPGYSNNQSQLRVTFVSGAPHSYLVTFEGYTPTNPNCITDVGTGGIFAAQSGGVVYCSVASSTPGGVTSPCPSSLTATSTCAPICPTGMQYEPPPINLGFSAAIAPLELPIAASDGACHFRVQAEKKYVEITKLLLIGTGPCAPGAKPSTLTFSEGLKSYFGLACQLDVYGLGTVILKSGVDCSAAGEGNLIGKPAPGFYTESGIKSVLPIAQQSVYACTGDTLSVINIPSTGLNSPNLPIDWKVTGPGALLTSLPSTSLSTNGTNFLCAGTAGNTTLTGVPEDQTLFLCPTGPGTGTVQACLGGAQSPAGGGGTAAVDTQPGACSNTLTFAFILPPNGRVVPYVRWAGEKQVLTKCFGFGLGLDPVEFTLSGAGTSAQAALIPAAIPNDTSVSTSLKTPGGKDIVLGPGSNPGNGGGTAAGFPVTSQNTVWTITDPNGCATVIVFAATEGTVVVDASIFGDTATTTTPSTILPLINEHAFEIFYLKFDHLDIENIKMTKYASSTLSSPVNSLSFNTVPPDLVGTNTYAQTEAGSGVTTGPIFGAPLATFNLPNAPGSNPPPSAAGYPVPLCMNDYVRAMVHGYFELPGNPSGRPATNVALTNSPAGAAGSYVLPAGRWVLPEDWPVLATFAGFSSSGAPFDASSASVYAWDLNSGWAFNPGNERAVLCDGPAKAPYKDSAGNTVPGSGAIDSVIGAENANSSGAYLDNAGNPVQVSYGPCFGQDSGANGSTSAGVSYSTADDDLNCDGGITVGFDGYDPTQSCTSPFPLNFSPQGSGVPVTNNPINILAGGGLYVNFPLSENSSFLPNGTLNQWDAPMPAAQISFTVTNGPGLLGQVDKTSLYSIPTSKNAVDASGNVTTACTNLPVSGLPSTTAGLCHDIYPNPFYATSIPPNPLIPPVANNGGYLWDTYGFFTGAGFSGPALSPGFVAGESDTIGSISTGGTGLAPGTCGANWKYLTTGAVLDPTTGSDGAGGTLLAPTTACYLRELDPGDADNALGVTNDITAVDCYNLGEADGGTANKPIYTRFVKDFTATANDGVTEGSCYVAPAPTNPAVGSGLNTTDFGPGCPAHYGQGSSAPTISGSSVSVVSTAGFVVGDTVEVIGTSYNASTSNFSSTNPPTSTTALGNPNTPDGLIATDLVVTAVDPTTNTLTFDPASVPADFCLPAYSGVFVSENLQVTVANSATTNLDAGCGTAVTVVNTQGNTAGATIACDARTGHTTSNLNIANSNGTTTLFLATAEDLAFSLGGCNLSREASNGDAMWGACEPGPGLGGNSGWLLAGSSVLIGNGNVNPVQTGQQMFGGQGPYPFWQWVPNPAGTAGTSTTTAEMYSDNHGESVVALTTGVGGQVAPTNNTCPAGYYAITTAGTTTVTNCVLQLGALGTTKNPTGNPFGNVAAAQAAYSQTSPGCITTSSTGTIVTPTAVATATGTPVPQPAVGGHGPLPGQICVNKLGGTEFGMGATLGSTTIQAVADYPYFRGLHPPITSGPVTKIFSSAFMKDVTVSPLPNGIPGPNGITEYNVTITAMDVCGNPIVGEPVNVFVLGNAGAAVLAALSQSTVTATNADTVYTNANGQATLSLEVLNTAVGNAGITIKAVFPLESVERIQPVIPGTIPGATATVIYQPGYNMVGGPPGSNFTSVEGIFSYNSSSNSYVDASAGKANITSAAPSCTGYYAYFAGITSVSLPATSHSGDTAVCTLAAGWNLIGNPFATNAALPSSVTAYHWNGTSYDQVGVIPVGGAVFIFNSGAATTVTLTAQ